MRLSYLARVLDAAHCQCPDGRVTALRNFLEHFQPPPPPSPRSVRTYCSHRFTTAMSADTLSTFLIGTTMWNYLHDEEVGHDLLYPGIITAFTPPPHLRAAALREDQLHLFMTGDPAPPALRVVYPFDGDDGTVSFPFALERLDADMRFAAPPLPQAGVPHPHPAGFLGRPPPYSQSLLSWVNAPVQQIFWDPQTACLHMDRGRVVTVSPSPPAADRLIPVDQDTKVTIRFQRRNTRLLKWECVYPLLLRGGSTAPAPPPPCPQPPHLRHPATPPTPQSPAGRRRINSSAEALVYRSPMLTPTCTCPERPLMCT